jgi:hypothetical protein
MEKLGLPRSMRLFTKHVVDLHIDIEVGFAKEYEEIQAFAV